MQQDELILLINRVKEHKCEMQDVEIKTAEKGCPTRLYDTLSAFSNQDNGGIIIFGISEDKDFATVGVYNAQDLQKKVTEQCKQMEPVIRPLFTVANYEGKTVVSAEIPGVDVNERPVFYKGVGRIKGSYVRVGESDEQMSEYEIYSYEAYRRKINDELRVLTKCEFTDVNKDEITLFLAKLRIKKPNLAGLTEQKNLLTTQFLKGSNSMPFYMKLALTLLLSHLNDGLTLRVQLESFPAPVAAAEHTLTRISRSNSHHGSRRNLNYTL